MKKIFEHIIQFLVGRLFLMRKQYRDYKGNPCKEDSKDIDRDRNGVRDNREYSKKYIQKRWGVKPMKKIFEYIIWFLFGKLVWMRRKDCINVFLHRLIGKIRVYKIFPDKKENGYYFITHNFNDIKIFCKNYYKKNKRQPDHVKIEWMKKKEYFNIPSSIESYEYFKE